MPGSAQTPLWTQCPPMTVFWNGRRVPRSGAIRPEVDRPADVTTGRAHRLAPWTRQRDDLVDVVAQRHDGRRHRPIRRVLHRLAFRPSRLRERFRLVEPTAIAQAGRGAVDPVVVPP